MNLSSEQVLRLAKRSKKEALENSFMFHWVTLFPQLPPPSRQHHFCERKWAFDFAWPDDGKIAVELAGGAWMARSGHNTAAGQAKDYIKHNQATALGWRILYFNSLQLQDMAACVTEVAELLTNAEDVPYVSDHRPMP